MVLFLGTAFINAVFYGVKLESGAEPPDSLIGAPREAACSSSATIAIPLNTRKHVLQVSTYQVKMIELELIKFQKIHVSFFI